MRFIITENIKKNKVIVKRKGEEKLYNFSVPNVESFQEDDAWRLNGTML